MAEEPMDTQPIIVNPTARYTTNIMYATPPQLGDEARGGDFLFCRFQQQTDIHDELVRQLFARDSIINIQQSLTLPSTTYQIYNHHTGLYEDAAKPALHPIPNIRFLTFHVQITGNPANPIIFTVVPTLPVDRFLCVNLLNEAGAGIVLSDGTIRWDGMNRYNDLFGAFARKIYVELSTTGLNMNHPCQFYTSFDVYYNRERGLGGSYHKDEFYGEGNDTLFASLEFIMPDGVATLGTEVILDRAPRAYPAHVHPDEARDLVARGTESFRCVSTNGSVTMFNNKRCIHASPETSSTLATTPERVIFDPAIHPHRVLNRMMTSVQTGVPDLEATALNAATETIQRSFIRTWYSNDAPILDVLIGSGKRCYVLALNLVGFDPRTPFEPLTPHDLRGGKTRKMLGGIKELFNFKIASNYISLLINDAVEYEEIDLIKIDNYLQDEKKFLMKISCVCLSKKVGGKTKRKKQRKRTRKKY
jgi:hypothetical protein